MATLNKSVLGKIRGSIGDITFKQKNGKNYVSIKPSSFKPGIDPDSVARREKFRLVSQIIKTMNKDAVLKAIWKAYTPSGMSTYNYMFKTVYQFMGNDLQVGNIKLIPGLGFRATKSAIQLDENRLLLTVNPLGTNTDIDTENEVEVSLYAFSFLNKPNEIGYKSEQLFIHSSANQLLDINNSMSFTIELNSEWNQLYSYYLEKKAAFILVTKDLDGNPVRFSSSFI